MQLILHIVHLPKNKKISQWSTRMHEIPTTHNSISRRMSADEHNFKQKKQSGHFTATLFHMFNRRKSSMDSMMQCEQQAQGQKYESKTLPRNLTPIPSPDLKDTSSTSTRRIVQGSKSKMSSWAWARQRQNKHRSPSATSATSPSSSSPGVRTYTPKRNFPSRSRLSKDTFENFSKFCQESFEPAATSSSSESCKRTSSMSDRSSDSSSSRDVFEEIKEIAEVAANIPGSHYSPLIPAKSSSSINTLSSSPNGEGKEAAPIKTRRINGLSVPPPPGMFEQSKRKTTMYRKKWMRKSSIDKQDSKVAGSPVKTSNSYEFDVWDGRNAMTLPRKHKQNRKYLCDR